MYFISVKVYKFKCVFPFHLVDKITSDCKFKLKIAINQLWI